MNWNEVRDDKDIGALLEAFGGFDDSCLKELYMWNESYVDEHLSMSMSADLDTNVRILFQRQFRHPSAIEMLFEGVTQCHIIPAPINGDCIILEATVIKYGNLFYWSNEPDWEPEDDVSRSVSWISSRALK